MFKNHLKIAWRNIVKNKSMFLINIVGLALGIATCLIIALFVIDELSYDRFNEKADDIVRVVFKARVNNEEIKEAVVMAPVAETLKNEFPEVSEATRIRDRGIQKITLQDNSHRKANLALVDSNFFEVFTFPIIEGNSVSPLREPNSIVITRKKAENYFGTIQAALGKQVYLNVEEQGYTITGVIEDVPKNSHFHFELFASMLLHKPAKSKSWTDSGFHTYLVLKNGYDPALLESKLPQLLERHMGPEIQQAMGVSYAEFTEKNQLGLFLQPLTDIHLNSDFTAASQIEEGGDAKYIYIFSVVALFMLLIACINFMNLSTATAAKRAKEVGIKKVLGSDKRQLIFQFLTEALLATVFAMIFAGVLLVLSLPFFNSLSEKELKVSYLLKPSIIALLSVLTLVIGFLAGGYPAFLLSSFRPVTALKSKFYGNRNSKGLRNGLVVFQFVISTGLIFAILTVNKQMSFIQNKELGYEKDQILVIRDSPALGSNEVAFVNETVNDVRVLSATRSAHVPAGPSAINMSGVFMNSEFQRRMFVYNIDEHYIPTMGMELISGRNFSRDFGADSTNVIINQSGAKALGFSDNAVNQRFELDTKEGRKSMTIVGVVKDFHYKSLHHAIEPLFMHYAPSGGLIVRAKVGEMGGLIASMEKKWNSFNSEEPFNYSLLDEAYNQTYVSEQKMGNILNIFAVLTIFIACLGLFGLVTFTAEQRFKEIGIRKVLGSTVMEIMSMLSKDFLKLVFIAFFIAFPLGYYLMDKWLQGFAYHTDIQWWFFVLTALVTIVIAFGTISWKSFRAATMNPVKALKDE